jgi:hypothetical protein
VLRRAGVVGALVLALLAAPAAAQMDWSEPEIPPPPSDEAMRDAIRAEIAARAAAERAAAAAAAEAAAAAAARDEALRAARPPGERLLELRCLTCHDRRQIDAKPHGRVIWWATVLRMEWLNGAALHRGERAVLVAHLADGREARTRMEWGALAGGAAVLVASGVAVRRLGRRTWRRQVRS